MKSNYYAVLAGNGVMLATDYCHAVYCRDHAFQKPRTIRSFASLADAREAAVDHLWDVAPLNRYIPENLELYRVYYGYTLPYNT